jgi:hypothetical protein
VLAAADWWQAAKEDAAEIQPAWLLAAESRSRMAASHSDAVPFFK